MKKIYTTFILVAAALNAHSVGLEASYNVTFVSFANVQIAARNITNGFGLYTSVRGLSNGSSVNGSKEIYDELLSMQEASDKFGIAYSDAEILRSGVSFGVNKQWKFLFIGGAAGYCDVINQQTTTVTSRSGIKKSFRDQNGVSRELEWEVLFGSTPEFGRIYIPIYVGWSFNYSTFFGLGVGWKFQSAD
ncbi:MAG: hypothetical protein LBT94_03530 [Prevotellaceae bacterium]|jgi:hypothetical protein|nr:hypothetical protein [Prevotellaceae bacterium]